MLLFQLFKWILKMTLKATFRVIDSAKQSSKCQLNCFYFVCFAAGKQRETAEQFESKDLRNSRINIKFGLLLAVPISSRWFYHTRWPCAHICISPERTEARYDKIHLFKLAMLSVDIKNPASLNLDCSHIYPFWQYRANGMLWLPELALTLRQQGAHLLTAHLPIQQGKCTGSFYYKHV